MTTILRSSLMLILNLLMNRIKDYEQFRNDLGWRESKNNYQLKNSLGYLGRYQFGMARLADFGLCERVSAGYGNNSFVWKEGFSEDSFLTNQPLQDSTFDKHVDNLITRIQNNFGGYIGTTKKGVLITLSGLVAGSHIGGIGGIKDFLMYGIDKKDAYGTSISNYIKSFGGYFLKVV